MSILLPTINNFCVFITNIIRSHKVFDIRRIRLATKENYGMNRIREVLLLKSLKQKDLAKMTGITENDISKIVNDRKEIHLTTAKKIAKALGKSVEYLWPD